MIDRAKEEIKRQASTETMYTEPITGFGADDADVHLENLHELYYRFSLMAAKEGLEADFIADLGHTYYVLWMFLKDIVKNSETFEELKSQKTSRP